jgi:hypothetical protein
MKFVLNIFRPWCYFIITPYTRDKLAIDWLLPICLTLILIVPTYMHNSDGQLLFINDSFLNRLLSFFQSLPGFYLAALAAIATFNKPDLDEYLLGTPLQLVDSNNNLVRLTRRRFLSIMFSCLTAQSFLIILLTSYISANLYDTLNLFSPIFFWIIGFFIYLLFCQLIFITLWGLFYLGEKIHISNR